MARERHILQDFPGFQANESGSADRRRLPESKPKHRATTSRPFRERALLAVMCCVLLVGCRSQPVDAGPSIEFSKVPPSRAGGTEKVDTISGRVIGARAGQQVVLFARSGIWYVQPFADQPFTEIQPDSKWSNSTHLGTEYAAFLVEADYHPPSAMDVLPSEGGGVVALIVVNGEPEFWQTWWFRLSAGMAILFSMLALYRFRLRQLTAQMNVRFEERLAERTRIAQELHDTLLQGFLSASMQLHVAADRLPENSPAKSQLTHVLQLMGRVIEEGRNAVQGLRSSDSSGSLDLEQSFSRIRQELALEEQIDFRVIVEGRPRHLHPLIRDEVYRIGHEALVNAFHHSRAKSIEVEVEYLANHLRILVRDDGCGIDPQVLRSGRDGHWGLSGMRERAERIGARFKVRSRAATGTEVELSVPGQIAYQVPSSKERPPRWYAALWPPVTGARLRRPRSEGDE